MFLFFSVFFSNNNDASARGVFHLKSSKKKKFPFKNLSWIYWVVVFCIWKYAKSVHLWTFSVFKLLTSFFEDVDDCFLYFSKMIWKFWNLDVDQEVLLILCWMLLMVVTVPLSSVIKFEAYKDKDGLKNKKIQKVKQIFSLYLRKQIVFFNLLIFFCNSKGSSFVSVLFNS
jgi:hypothetical protein